MTSLELTHTQNRTRATWAFAVAATLTLTLASATAQGPISWTVKNITSRGDISLKGKLCIAINLGPEVCEKVVNGVHFQADRSHWTRKIHVPNGNPQSTMYFPDFTSGGFVLKMPYNRTAPRSNGNGGTDVVGDPDYTFITKDVRHNPSPNHPKYVTQCSIEGLTPGSTYEIQLWFGNKNQPNRISEWDNGVGGREGKGGVFLRCSGPNFGQVATGTFVATASGKQTFTNYQQPADLAATPPLKDTFNACSAIQIRDLTPKPLRARATYYGEGTPGTNRQPILGGTACSPAIAMVGHPVVSNKVALTAENSSGVASVAIIVFGTAPATINIFSGELLVTPVVLMGLPMPASVAAPTYTHDHELQLPFTVPAAPGTVYAQVVQLDKGAVGGYSFTPGMAIEIGFSL